MSIFSKISTELTSKSWWKASTLRAVYTAISVFLPFFGTDILITEVNWTVAASTVGLAVVVSFLTSLAGLKEVEGGSVPKSLALAVRAIKQFAQTLVAYVGATLLITDIDWGNALTFSLTSAIVSLLRGALTHLPEQEERFEG